MRSRRRSATSPRDPGRFLPRQFTNEANVDAHDFGTGREILAQLGGLGLRPAAFVAGVGTGGTVMGVARAFRRFDPSIRQPEFTMLTFRYGLGTQSLGISLPTHPHTGVEFGTGLSISTDGVLWETASDLESCRNPNGGCVERINLAAYLDDLSIAEEPQSMWLKFQHASLGSTVGHDPADGSLQADSLWIDKLVIASPADTDWYQFRLDDGAEALVRVVSVDTFGEVVRIYDSKGQLIVADQARVRNIDTDGQPNDYFVQIISRGEYQLSVIRGASQAIVGRPADHRSAFDEDGYGRFLVRAKTFDPTDEDDDERQYSYQREFEDLDYDNRQVLPGAELELRFRASVPEIAFLSEGIPKVGIEYDDLMGFGEVNGPMSDEADIWVAHEAAYYVLDLQFDGLASESIAVTAHADRRKARIDEVSVAFDAQLDLRTVSVEDFSWDGPPILTTRIAGGQAVLSFAEPVPPGEYTIRVEGDSMFDSRRRQVGTRVLPIDLQPSRIASLSIRDGDVLPSGDAVLVITFDEPIVNLGLGNGVHLQGPTGTRQIGFRDVRRAGRDADYLMIPLPDLQPGEHELSINTLSFSDRNNNQAQHPPQTISFRVEAPDGLRAIRRNFDLNGDGIIGALDLDVLQALSRSDDLRHAWDLTGDEKVTEEDMGVFAREALSTRFGDANLDGVFNSTDLVAMLTNGLDRRATWSTGDFSGDGRFDSHDLVLALQAGPPNV